MMDLKASQKRTWVNVNLDAVEYNFNLIKTKLKNSTKMCCVVKANCYGHGAVQLSKLYEKLGADYLAVSNIEEAMQLRKADIHLPILILGYTDPRCVDELSKYNITQCVFSYEYGKALSNCAIGSGVNIKIHIKLDTGMGRIGFQCQKNYLDDVVNTCRLKCLVVEGIFTHFASADEGCKGKEYTLKQFLKFKESVEYIETKGIKFDIKHCANSAAIFDYPEMQLDMVRAGIVLYGLQPSEDLINSENLQPVLELKTIVDFIKIVNKGDCISYGRTFKADKDMRVATIPIGYADGLWRANSCNHMCVEVCGKFAPIIGRICMDQCMVDISDIPEVEINSEVTIYGGKGKTSVDQIAKANQTINYEIVCAIGARVPRVYRKNNKTVVVMDNII